MIYYLMIGLKYKDQDVSETIKKISYCFNSEPMYHKGKWYKVAPFSTRPNPYFDYDAKDYFNKNNISVLLGSSTDDNSPCIEQIETLLFNPVIPWRIEIVSGEVSNPEPYTVYIWFTETESDVVEVETQVGSRIMWDGIYSVTDGKLNFSIPNNGNFRLIK